MENSSNKTQIINHKICIIAIEQCENRAKIYSKKQREEVLFMIEQVTAVIHHCLVLLSK